MISTATAKEIADRMEKLEIAESCLKKTSDIRQAHLVVEIYNDKLFRIDLGEDYCAIKKIIEKIAEDHRLRLVGLNDTALKEAQSSEEPKANEGKKNGRS